MQTKAFALLLALTSAAGGILWWCAQQLTAARPATFSELVEHAAVALVGVLTGWLWTRSTPVLLDVMTSRAPRRTTGWLPRVLLSACGLGLLVSAPAQAADEPWHSAWSTWAINSNLAASSTGAQVLDGLPLPEVPLTAGQPQTAPASPSQIVRSELERAPSAQEAPPTKWHTVQPGDTLWGLAVRSGRHLSTTEISQRVRQWHNANRQVIGANPDHLEPGQRLILAVEQSR